MKQKLRALKIILSKELVFAGSNMHTTTLYIDYKIIESQCASKVYDAVMLFNYKDYVLYVLCKAAFAWGSPTVTS